MRLRSILTIVAVCLVAPSARAQLVVGSDQAGATIYHIDVGTGAATPLLLGTGAVAWGMAYDKSTNTLYWNNGSVLWSSPFSIAGLTPTNLGTMTYLGSSVNFVGLGFRGGKLIGTRNIATEAVYEIDPATRVATLVYTYSSTLDLGGVDVDATTDRLYALSDTGGLGLYEIDTGAMTTTLRAPYPGGQTDIDGLAAYNDLAYYVVDQPGLFYVYRISTGAQVGTLTSPFTGSAVFSAAAYVPDEPVGVEKTSWDRVKNLYR